MPGEPPPVSLDFLSPSPIVIVPPGAGVLDTPAAGLAHGWRASVAAER
jgi:hypothetical protein